jgi:Beta propeller domain
MLATLLLGLATSSCTNGPTSEVHANVTVKPKKTMRAFKSEKELKKYLKSIAAKQREQLDFFIGEQALSGPTGLFTVYDGNSITNVQHAGVDEGGIIKLHGDHLVVLRRGRLFTINVADEALKPVSVVDAFAPDIDPKHTWYDELLISGDTIIVIGYSYERGGTEIGLFNIDAKGNLAYRSTYHLRSNDYFSSRNYASRLVRGKLIFYTPLRLWTNEKDPFTSFPALRKWHKGATDGEFRTTASPTQVYRPEYQFKDEDSLALHTVTVCDPTGGELRCESTCTVGPYGRVFYVAPESVYVWLTDSIYWNRQAGIQSLLYRMPLDGSAPSALKVSGSPVDQFSFLESSDSYLNVLVRSHGYGDGMWGAENASGDTALLRVPIVSFSDGGEKVSTSNYRKLPKPDGEISQNRFVGDYLLYGRGNGWGWPQTEKFFKHAVYAVRWSGGEPIKLPLRHSVDRIEVMGAAAVVVGTRMNDLHFTAISLDNYLPTVKNEYVRSGASQGELRSHAFFYKSDGPHSGVLGLPISEPGRPGYEHLFRESASILYLRNDSMNLTELGNLASNPKNATDDLCRASCVDWYGNSQPLFLKGRVFALLGYELVEGEVANGRIREKRRSNYSPQVDSARN